MALDILEPVGPEAERFVLDMLEGRTFRQAEFTETEDGHVRLRAPLIHELAENMPRWARSLAPGPRRWPTCSATPWRASTPQLRR